MIGRTSLAVTHAGGRTGLQPLKQFAQVRVDGLDEPWVVLRGCDFKCLAICLNGFGKTAQVSIDAGNEMQCQRVLSAR